VRLEVYVELLRRTTGGLGQDRTVALERAFLDLGLQRDVRLEEGITPSRKQELPGRADPVPPVHERAEAVKRKPPVGHRQLLAGGAERERLFVRMDDPLGS